MHTDFNATSINKFACVCVCGEGVFEWMWKFSSGIVRLLKKVLAKHVIITGESCTLMQRASLRIDYFIHFVNWRIQAWYFPHCGSGVLQQLFLHTCCTVNADWRAFFRLEVYLKHTMGVVRWAQSMYSCAWFDDSISQYEIYRVASAFLFVCVTSASLFKFIPLYKLYIIVVVKIRNGCVQPGANKCTYEIARHYKQTVRPARRQQEEQL